jgi:hypothetical protein
MLFNSKWIGGFILVFFESLFLLNTKMFVTVNRNVDFKNI